MGGDLPCRPEPGRRWRSVSAGVPGQDGDRSPRCHSCLPPVPPPRGGPDRRRRGRFPPQKPDRSHGLPPRYRPDRAFPLPPEPGAGLFSMPAPPFPLSPDDNGPPPPCSPLNTVLEPGGKPPSRDPPYPRGRGQRAGTRIARSAGSSGSTSGGSSPPRSEAPPIAFRTDSPPVATCWRRYRRAVPPWQPPRRPPGERSGRPHVPPPAVHGDRAPKDPQPTGAPAPLSPVRTDAAGPVLPPQNTRMAGGGYPYRAARSSEGSVHMAKGTWSGAGERGAGGPSRGGGNGSPRCAGAGPGGRGCRAGPIEGPQTHHPGGSGGVLVANGRS